MPTPSELDADDTALEAQVFWLRYGKEIAVFAIALLLALVAFAGWRFYRERRDAAASGAFAEAKSASAYEDVINRYGDTPAAAAAFLLLAEDQRKAGKFADANATLQRFIDKFPRHELVSTARMSMAGNLEAMGKHDEAISAYQQIAATAPGSFNAPLALAAEAEILHAQNRDDEARRVCETIMTQYGRTYAAAEAAQMLRSLKPAAPAAPSPAANHAASPPPDVSQTAPASRP